MGLGAIADKAAAWLFGQPAAVVLVAIIAGVLLYAIHVEMPAIATELRGGLREQQERFERFTNRQMDECEKFIDRQREHDIDRTAVLSDAIKYQSDAIIENTRQLRQLCEKCDRPLAKAPAGPASASK